MPATDGSVYSWAIESSRKTLGDNTAMTIAPFQSIDYDVTRTFSPSGEARDDFFDSKEDFVSREGRLTQNRKFRPQVFDHNLEQAYWNNFTRKTGRYNGYGAEDAQITSVTAGTSTIAVTTGPAFAPRLIVRFTGFTNPQNNGVRVLTTGSNATTLVVADGGLVTEAPPRGARIEVVGIELAAGDLSISGQTLVSAAAVDFAALLGAAKGHWCKVGAASERNTGANRFNTDVVNDAVRISSLSPTGTISLDRTPVGWTNDAGTGKSIWLFFAEPLIPGTTEITVTEQVAIKLADNSFDRTRLVGGYVETVEVAGEAMGDYGMSVTKRFLDFNDESPADLNARADGPIREAEEFDAFVAGLAGQRLYFNGVYSTETAAVRSSTLTIAPTLVPIPIEGCFGYLRMARSTQTMRVSGEAHFETAALAAPYRTGQRADFVRVMPSGSFGYVFEAPKVQFLNFKQNLPGQGEAVTANFEFKATADNSGIAAGNFATFGAIHRFRAAEGWPKLC